MNVYIASVAITRKVKNEFLLRIPLSNCVPIAKIIHTSNAILNIMALAWVALFEAMKQPRQLVRLFWPRWFTEVLWEKTIAYSQI